MNCAPAESEQSSIKMRRNGTDGLFLGNDYFVLMGEKWAYPKIPTFLAVEGCWA